MLHTFSPANHLCTPPLPSSNPNRATESSLVGLGPQTSLHSLLPLVCSPGLGTACSHRANNGQDVGAEPRVVGGGLLLCFQEGEGALPFQCSHLS